ncbi:hypothetical protein O181_121920 [Austropuccinia psidii MF-1]|uniref:Uncharacterized protein n=1 Tax=Austropuccinia psidii MF-1 TaxID=1389203 RepID=A0A9Q3KN60_9BASI|nr:hypothetical protein [Austropuccinia psidii MF-1]
MPKTSTRKKAINNLITMWMFEELIQTPSLVGDLNLFKSLGVLEELLDDTSLTLPEPVQFVPTLDMIAIYQHTILHILGSRYLARFPKKFKMNNFNINKLFDMSSKEFKQAV